MSELSFCKSFLSALDARPAKLSSDHIADARQYPAQGAYTLPRLQHPPHPQRPNPKTSTDNGSTSTSSQTISITLKPMKPSTPTIPLSSIDPAKTSVYDIKQQFATQASLSAAKIKILYKKKPVTDSKTLLEVIGSDAGSEVEFGVMVMAGAALGGAASPAAGSTPVASPPAVAPPTESEKGLASAGETIAGTASGTAGSGAESGKDIVATDEFWGDLKAFMLQRIKDAEEGERLVGVFKEAWQQNK
ncbi:Blt1 domain containing protein [Pyrenophora tritici-repentis]|uniref:Blt1 N-terminal domain containing protein n=1 Tax=Pyrenophora tritici-repentis TaxID=45151 RepID=A0A2W1ELL3_9PLEO|nr:Blt1 domain-containing protein [Pyrenophora tritici-repentis]KAF7454282.1 Blt1 domain containing protein [Pyrenophora tritici-repentis]KAF7577381.1 Blt1 domain containing protein [Pyrenophora tritici-repentis]KAG9388029.1 Blt1 domain containing protein [Pyrenophora tritici-repentis]KAI0584846.1 Blt1 domain-containing protein [Pyrenophora tritici-repentis]